MVGKKNGGKIMTREEYLHKGLSCLLILITCILENNYMIYLKSIYILNYFKIDENNTNLKN